MRRGRFAVAAAVVGALLPLVVPGPAQGGNVVGGLLGGRTSGAPATAATSAASSGRTIVFNGEDNRLNAYDAATFAKQTVIPSAAEGGLDINAQICFQVQRDAAGAVESVHFIAGEDTGQPERPAGWGWFELHGDTVGSLSATQVGKLVPTYQPTTDNPENYGCGFLADGRVVTTDVGNQLPLTAGTGQLIVWFPPFDRFEVPYCKIDVGIPTANGVWVGPDDSVYVASAREDLTQQRLPSVYRYHGDWPTGPDAAGGCGQVDRTGAPLVSAGRVQREAFIVNPLSLTPSGVAGSGHGTLYVTSVFTGTIVEYSMAGTPVRVLMAPPIGGQLLPGGTPFGIGVGPDGTIYYADIGVVLAGPAPADGSVQAIKPTSSVLSLTPPTVIDQNLDFPDGIGILHL